MNPKTFQAALERQLKGDLAKFSDDQPRAPNGQFGSGGGGGAKELGDRAHAASRTANQTTGTRNERAAAHSDASEAHGRAADAYHREGNRSKEDEHSRMARDHYDRADRLRDIDSSV